MPEEIDETIIEKTFIKHVFNFSENNKSLMLNMVQYTILAFLPVIVVLKITKIYVPEPDENKGSIEILAESLLQIIFIIISFWFINKIITFIPTYSGKNYKEFNETTFIIGFIFILLTLQTKLGEKISILSDRFMDIWTGENNIIDNKQRHQNIRVKQPFSNIGQNNSENNMQNIQQIQQIQQIQNTQPPPPPIMTNNKSITNEYNINNIPNKQQLPDYNTMYQGPITPLPNSKHPDNSHEPVAANEFGGNFGSAW